MSMDQIGLLFTALFFLWFGLKTFIPALNSDMFQKAGAVLAILVGIKALLGAFGM